MFTKKKYPCKVNFHGRKVNRIIINQHAQKHKKHGITDQLILALIKNLHNKKFEPESQQSLWKFFVFKPYLFQGKKYRLVCCMHGKASFVEVITCFPESD